METNNDFNTLIKRLVNRAGLDAAMVEMGREDFEFNLITLAMRKIHRGKEVLYGNYLHTHGNDPEKFALMEHFCDVKRKYVRAESFLKATMEGRDIPLDELLDTYADMAVYAVMGIQMILHLERRGIKHETSTGFGEHVGKEPSAGDHHT